MYIKVATVKIKVKGKREKRVYKYVRVVDRERTGAWSRPKEKVIATLGELDYVRGYLPRLIEGLKRLTY